ncbi:MAG: DEAD/DEAH box helicase family protein [Bacteroidales bacterium]|jgi:superfamily II DNA or RNA helicase|nr:DEAD/DEAH box helicase family protein [Bacteroidales bacterium]
MLKSEVHLPPHRQYESATEYEPLDFFSECLCNSKRFDLKLGFFSSSAIRTLSDGFALFLHNGGKMRLIINNILSMQDKNAIIAGAQRHSGLDPQSPIFDLSDIATLKNTLSESEKHFFDCLAWLIAEKRIEIKVITPKDTEGIAHTKEGVFADENNTVGFNGSCNFSRTALLENKESIDVNCDWDGEVSTAKLQNTVAKFEKTFSGNDETVQYIEPRKIITNISMNFGGKNLDELFEIESELLGHKNNTPIRQSIKKALDKAKRQVEQVIEKEKEEDIKPEFPYPQGARVYQQTAFENWKNNKQQGLFAMATGTGKTITSLNCLLEIYKKTGYYKALILVPTITLVNQWESECRKFNFIKITKVCSKSPRWKNEIGSILLQEKLQKAEQVSYIVIATYASFARPNIFAELNQLSAKTLLIADECHNMGSVTMLKLLSKVTYKRRIGLSATPERQFDEEGNKKLFTFFNSENGYTYEYSMQEAINKGVLCRYYYFPHLVELTDEELKQYMQLSEKISKYYNSNSDSFKNDPILTALLLARKRIIHKTFNKVAVFNNILKEYYNKKHNLKYTLVYVPEGNDPNDYFETDFYTEKDKTETDNEAVHLIDVFTKAVRDIDNRTTVRQFVSGIVERDEILEQFAKGDIDVLTSMKCLDEGVDVPRAEFAIFCASTGNPRQFVQRRGRILRQHPDKQFAYIHDLVVIPEINPNSDSYEMERSMLKKELERVDNFSLLSENSSHTLDVLLDTMNHYNLNLYHNE